MRLCRPDLKGVHTRHGDYVEGELAGRMDTPKLVGDLVSHWIKFGERRRTVVFAVNVAHSLHICAEFQSCGIRAEHLDGGTPLDEREAILARLASGETEVVTNCMVLTEGWDCPEVGCCVLARPTKKMGLFRQMIGRVLRPADGKADAIVLDHSGAVYRHGLPEDPVLWTLDPDEVAVSPEHAKRSERPETSLIECTQCSAMRMGGKPCPACGFMPKRPARDIVFADGNLSLVSGEARATSLEERIAFYSELRQIQLDRKYKSAGRRISTSSGTARSRHGHGITTPRRRRPSRRWVGSSRARSPTPRPGSVKPSREPWHERRSPARPAARRAAAVELHHRRYRRYRHRPGRWDDHARPSCRTYARSRHRRPPRPRGSGGSEGAHMSRRRRGRARAFDKAARNTRRRREIERHAIHVGAAETEDLWRWLVAWVWNNPQAKDPVGAIMECAHRIGRKGMSEIEPEFILDEARRTKRRWRADPLAKWLGSPTPTVRSSASRPSAPSTPTSVNVQGGGSCENGIGSSRSDRCRGLSPIANRPNDKNRGSWRASAGGLGIATKARRANVLMGMALIRAQQTF